MGACCAEIDEHWQVVLGGIRGAEPGQLDEPRGVVVTAAGVWVVDMNNHRVCLFR